MNVIYKLTISPNIARYEMPKNSELLYVREQGEDICVWFFCDPKEKGREIRTILSFGTGHTGIGQDLKYIGSGHLNSGALIFHIFDGGVVDLL